MPEERKPQGWADVQVNEGMPLNVLVNFLNVLNQRLVQVENVTQIPYDNHMISLTEFYHIQQEEVLRQQKEQEEAAQRPAESAEEVKGA